MCTVTHTYTHTKNIQRITCSTIGAILSSFFDIPTVMVFQGSKEYENKKHTQTMPGSHFPVVLCVTVPYHASTFGYKKRSCATILIDRISVHCPFEREVMHTRTNISNRVNCVFVGSLTRFFLSNISPARFSRTTCWIMPAAAFLRCCNAYCVGDIRVTLAFILVGDNIRDVLAAALLMVFLSCPAIINVPAGRCNVDHRSVLKYGNIVFAETVVYCTAHV